MKSRYLISLLALLAVPAPALAHQSGGQRHKAPMVTSMQASIDKGVAHPNTAEIKAASPITCLGGVSDDASSPTVNCKITGPGFTGILKKGEKANLTDAGTVTLNCTGRGWVRCNARIN